MRTAETPKSQRTTLPVSVTSKFAARIAYQRWSPSKDIHKIERTFHIPVNNRGAVDEGESRQTFADDNGSKAFLYYVVLCGFHLLANHQQRLLGRCNEETHAYQGSNTTPTSVVHDDPNTWTFKMTTIVHRNVLLLSTSELTEQVDLALNVINIVVLSIKIDNLQGDDVPCSNFSTFINCAIAASANDLELLVQLRYRDVFL